MGAALPTLAPWVAMRGSQRWPVGSWRKIAAAITAWAWVAVSLFCSRPVR
jgi:hypothetical protein